MIHLEAGFHLTVLEYRLIYSLWYVDNDHAEIFVDVIMIRSDQSF